MLDPTPRVGPVVPTNMPSNGVFARMAPIMLVHVMPVEDLKEHECSLSCSCQPRVSGEVVVHNSWDGREILERAVDELSDN